MQNKEQKFKCADTDGKDEGQRKIKYGRSTQDNRSNIKAMFEEAYQNIFNEFADQK